MSTIKAKLALDSTGFKAGLDKSKSALSSFKSGIGTIATGAAAAFATLGAGAALLGAGLKNAFDVGGALSDLSSQTGASVASLVVLQQAFKNNGLEAEKVGPAVAKMRKAIVGAMGDSKNDTFSKLGLDAKALGEMGAAEQLQAIGAAIDGIQNPTAKAAAAMEVFGKSGAEMLTLFADSSAMGSAAEQVGEQAQILDKNAALFDDISDKLNLVSGKMQAFFVGMGSKVAPAIKDAADALAKVDLSGGGKVAGDAIAYLITLISSGQIGRALTSQLTLSGVEFVNYLLRGFYGINTVFGGLLLASAEKFSSLMMSGIAAIMRELSKIPGLGKLEVGAKYADKAASATAENAKSYANVGATFKAGQAAAFQIDASELRDYVDALSGDAIRLIEANAAKADAFNAANQKPDISAAIGAAEESPIKAALATVGAAFTSSLAKIGGGGPSVGGSDPMLAENRRQTSLLEQIRRNTLPAKQVTPNLTARFA